jgi:hypothetical protein
LRGLGGELAGPLEAEEADVGEFAMSLVASTGLAELLVAPVTSRMSSTI